MTSNTEKATNLLKALQFSQGQQQDPNTFTPAAQDQGLPAPPPPPGVQGQPGVVPPPGPPQPGQPPAPGQEDPNAQQQPGMGMGAGAPVPPPPPTMPGVVNPSQTPFAPVQGGGAMPGQDPNLPMHYGPHGGKYVENPATGAHVYKSITQSATDLLKANNSNHKKEMKQWGEKLEDIADKLEGENTEKALNSRSLVIPRTDQLQARYSAQQIMRSATAGMNRQNSALRGPDGVAPLVGQTMAQVAQDEPIRTHRYQEIEKSCANHGIQLKEGKCPGCEMSKSLEVQRTDMRFVRR